MRRAVLVVGWPTLRHIDRRRQPGEAQAEESEADTASLEGRTQMAYDELLANRIRALLADREDVTERRMFGGLVFMVGGRMACGVVRDDLMVRVGAAASDDALAQPFTRPFDFTGRPSRGAVYVSPEGVRDGPDLARWIERGLEASEP